MLTRTAVKITPLHVVIILLIDSVLWGIWLGGLWSYRFAFASRLTNSYIHISISSAMPLIATLFTYTATIINHNFVRKYRVKLLKLSILTSRLMYLLASLVIYLNFFNSIKLLYIFSILLSLGYCISSVAGIAWTDYIADNLYDNWKPRYIALDTILSTLGALAGVSIAGVMFIEGNSVTIYGKLFLVISTIFLIDMPLIMLIKDFKEVKIHVEIHKRIDNISRKSIAIFYIATILLYIAINLSASLITPYIIYELNGNEMWITIINGASFIASLVTPIIWSEMLKKISSLTLLRIAITISIISIISFPHLKTLELQTIRSFIAGVGGIGIWMSIFNHMVRDVDDRYRVQHSSIIFLLQNIVPAIAMNVGGFIAEVFNSVELIFMLSTIAFAALPLTKFYERKMFDKNLKS